MALNRTSLALRARKMQRDARGRFLPQQRSYCGKKQYKSYECKARSIRAAAIERGEATEAEAPYIRFLAEYGE